METILIFCLVVFLAACVLGVVGVFLWFFFAMLLNFYKIYIKKIPAKKQCRHHHATFQDGLYGFWKCDECGENFPD